MSETAFIAAASRRNSKPNMGSGKLSGFHLDVVVLVRSMNHAVEHEFVDFGDNTDIARHQFANFSESLCPEESSGEKL